MELTEVQFWEDYWQHCALPSEVNPRLPFDRCLAHALKNALTGPGGDAFEIGCAPGKWLAFFVKTFGMRASGIEYSQAGMQATLRNFAMLGLSADAIMTGDFFKITPDRQFDVVMSFGFIEHFSDPDDVVARHLQWLKPGGTLILGVPNFKGIYSILQHFLDQDILDKHNLGIMNLNYFKGLAGRFALTPLYLNYIGSFEPSLLIARPGYDNPIQFLIKVLLRLAIPIRHFALWDHLNHPFISSYILAIYRKDAAH